MSRLRNFAGLLLSVSVLAIPPSTPAFAWGAYPNPQGFSNSRTLRVDYQSTFVRARVNRVDVKREVAPDRACTCTIWDRTRAVILDSHRAVVPFFELEKQGAFTGDAEAGTAFTNARIAAGASSVRDIETGKHILERDDFGRD